MPDEDVLEARRARAVLRLPKITVLLKMHWKLLTIISPPIGPTIFQDLPLNNLEYLSSPTPVCSPASIFYCLRNLLAAKS